MYSKNNQYPVTGLERIRLSDGSTRTGGQFTEEELADAGYKIVGNPPEITIDEVLEWDTENGEWSVREKTLEEHQEENKAKWNQLEARVYDALKNSEWTQFPDAFYGQQHKELYKQEYIRYREKLRGLILNKSGNPDNITFPTEPTSEDIQNLAAAQQDN
jgi:hypothetical protein